MKFQCPNCRHIFWQKLAAQSNGGKARQAKLTKDQKSELALAAANARWFKSEAR